MRRFLSVLSKLLLAYAFCGFVVLPAALHYAIYRFHPEYLTQPLSLGAVRFNPFILKLEVDAAHLGERDNVLLKFGRLIVDLSWQSVFQQAPVFDSIELLDPVVNIQLRRNGSINLDGVVRAQPEKDAKQNTTTASTISIFLGYLSVVNGRLDYSDFANTGDQPFYGKLDRIYVKGSGISWPKTQGELDLKARLNMSGKIDTQLTLEPGQDVTSVIGIHNIPLADIQPYLSPYTYLQIGSGLLSGQLQAEFIRGSGISAFGDVSIDSLSLTDERGNKPVAGWNELTISALTFHKDRINIAAITLDKPEVTVEIDQNLNLNLTDLVKPQPQSTGDTGGHSPSVDIESFRIDRGLLHFSDASFYPGFSAPISDLSGEITGFHTGSGAPATIQLNGSVDKYAPVSIFGHLDLAEPLQNTTVKMNFTDVELTTLTPYSGRFAGYNIQKGRLDLNLDYTIQQSQLNARNLALIKHLTLGEKVESEEATKLPLKLAIALLKDSDGRIDIDLPINGNLDDPAFEFGPLIRMAVVNFIGNIVKAPFKLLASLVSGDIDDMSVVLFKGGVSELSAEHNRALAKLVEALNVRPELVLEVEGYADRGLDTLPLARQEIEGEVFEHYRKSMADVGKVLSDGDKVPDDKRVDILYAIAKEQGVEVKGGLSSKALFAVLVESWPVSDIDLRELAINRARKIKDVLVGKGLEAQRVYILDVQTGNRQQEENSVESPRVATKLKLTAE